MSENIFPIITIPNIVLFPRTEINILITKKSQIAVINHCLINDTKFILSLGLPKEEEGDEIAPQGFKTYVSSKICTTAGPAFPQIKANNTLQFTAKGDRRVLLKKNIQDIPFATFEIEYLDDWEEEITFHQSVVGRLKTILFTWIDNYIADSLDRENIIDTIDTISDISSMISHYIIDDPCIKQILLEKRSLAERIKILNALLKPENPFYMDPNVVDAVKNFKEF